MNLNINSHILSVSRDIRDIDEEILFDEYNPVLLIGEIANIINNRFVQNEDKNSLLQNSSRLIMMELALKDGVTQLELAKNTHLKAPTISVTLQKLESKGLVVRKTDAYDLRAIRVYLTDKGKEHNKYIGKKVKEESDMVLNCLTDNERKQLFRVLTKLKSSLVEESEIIKY